MSSRRLLNSLKNIIQSNYFTRSLVRMATVDQITTNFKSRKYSLRQVPRLLDAEDSAVHLHKDGLHQGEIESLERLNWLRDRVLAPKLKAFSHGEYYLDVGLIGTKYFESREQLDSLYANEWRNTEPDSEAPFRRESISLREALQLLRVTISCNMDYYLANPTEMKTDLGKQALDSFDLSDKTVLKQLEGQLFHKQMSNIFGEDDGDEDGALMLKDFYFMLWDGNFAYATAQRGNYYWIFYYVTS